MLYSVHNTVAGGFDYYDGPDQVAINDDLPTPKYSSAIETPIGIPASLAGRPLPPGSRPIGHGDLPKGSMSTGIPGIWTGNKKSSLPSGMGAYPSDSSTFAIGAVIFLAVGTAIYLLARK